MARILVIDDETNVCMMMKFALQHVGHTVGTATDGQDGLDKYGDGKDWDLVLLDQRMPGLEGIEALKQIRRQNSNAKVIMATAFGTVDLAVEAMKCGAADFLRKPFTVEILRGAVSGAISGPEIRPGKLAASGVATGITFGMTTINGFRIEFQAGPGLRMADDLAFVFAVFHGFDFQ